MSGSGISIGDGIGLSAAHNGYEQHTTVSNNYVDRVSVEYQGGIGILAGWVAHTTITHNEITDVPGGAIALGWGWEHPTAMVDNHIDHNYVHDVMTSTLHDGGPIYVLGEHDSSTASTITNNYISGNPHPYGAIYLDGRASHWLVQDNVVENSPVSWLYIQKYSVGNTLATKHGVVKHGGAKLQ